VAERAAEAGYLAECFWPGLDRRDIERSAERVRRSAAELTREGTRVELTGSIVVPEDEVVFYLFTGHSADVVREACVRAGIRFERVVESMRTTERPVREEAQ
jgi:hypothetical protein